MLPRHNENAPAENAPARHPRIQAHEAEAAAFPAARFLTRHPLLDGDYRVVGYELKINERTPLPVLPG
nr:hypothetical protein [Thiobacillaceae bacterium]